MGVKRRRIEPALKAQGGVDRQMLGWFDRMRVKDDQPRDWFADAIRSYTKGENERTKKQDAEVKRQHSLVQDQKSRLLDLLLLKEVEADTYARKAAELRDREADLQLKWRRAAAKATKTPISP